MKLPDMLEAKKRDNKNIDFRYLDNIPKLSVHSGKKYYIRTYGCQMNVHDSEQLKSLVETLGYEYTDNFAESDLVILNTCAIRENAHDKVFGFLGRCKHLKEKKNDLIICLCGCMAQEKSVVLEILEKHKYIDIVIGTHNIHELRDLLIERNNGINVNVLSNSNEVIENVPYKHDSTVSAWVNIMYGCDKFCTYCIVPYTRGKQRSRKHEDIINEINSLISNGYKEVTLLGQNVNAYGKDLDSEVGFAKLLEMVAKTNIQRIRFVTSHPWDFSLDMLKVISENKNIMPYIHLPVQSGSNRILKLMGRRYTKEAYLDLFKKIKEYIPGVAITTDIIVGFPNETDEDFNETLDLVDKCEFDGAFTFIYSKRENTPASKMDDNISKEIKELRLQTLNKKVNKYSLQNNKEYLNTIVEVLIISVSERDSSKFMGYTETMKVVNVSGENIKIGDTVRVLIEDAKSFSLNGKKI